MATMVNVIPVETKPKVVPQGATTKDSTKSDQSTTGFAKVLNNQTDKNGKDDNTNTKDDAKAKDNTATQLMAAMMGMAVPAIATTVTSNPNSNQSSDKLANDLGADDTKGQLSEVAGNGLVTGMNTSPSQLAALLAKMTDTNASVDSNKVGELTQAQLQGILQVKQLLGQAQTADVSANKVDLTANKTLLGTIASFAAVDNSNGVVKSNSAAQVDSKKTALDRVTTGTTTTEDLAELVGTADVKHVTAPQSVVNVVDAITSDSKENTILTGGKAQLSAENALVDETVKDTDTFASLLNQQVVKNENQVVVSDAKQVPQQPVKDPYNIASQIVEQARVVTGQKNTEMIIQLKPEHLGELTLKVTVDSGVVSASFHSNNSEVRSIIEASLPQLKQDLSNQGLKIENVGVYAGLGDFFSNGQQRENQQQPSVKVHNKKIEEDFLEAIDSTGVTESTSDGSGVDYRI
ncbi:flagellar hook-length control protein FliK [Pelosinus sp. IPA-1]|uniref:flagellar hook-length control protein FliK n=1 Tax=Pelosinus sp. IPA-1 TaxID=3029569 RepID=UPI0024361521|nr:flagellar hook-length control protein FliK [Pelosinus sp. IPA-1]GMA99760.1 hypothetical protein PIPA1_25600 [Pelosinus sp. IPA-1]